MSKVTIAKKWQVSKNDRCEKMTDVKKYQLSKVTFDKSDRCKKITVVQNVIYQKWQMPKNYSWNNDSCLK